MILYLSSLILASAGAWLIFRWGKVLGLLDRSNDRSSHAGVVPKGGGVGILVAFLLASSIVELPQLFWIPIGLISLFSFYGDRKEIPAKVRLCVQFVAGVVLLAEIFHWEGRGYFKP